MACPTCYQDYISECTSSIIINAGLTADTDYSALFTDKFGHKYFLDFSTDGEGIGLISIGDDYDKLKDQFVPSGGWFKLEILDSNWDKVTMTIKGETYTCIEFEATGEIYEKQWLGEYTEESVSS